MFIWILRTLSKKHVTSPKMVFKKLMLVSSVRKSIVKYNKRCRGNMMHEYVEVIVDARTRGRGALAWHTYWFSCAWRAARGARAARRAGRARLSSRGSGAWPARTPLRPGSRPCRCRTASRSCRAPSWVASTSPSPSWRLSTNVNQVSEEARHRM